MLFLIICLFTVIVNFALGSFVYFRNPKGVANRQFAMFSCAVVGWVVTLFLYYVITDHLPLLFIGRLNFAIAIPAAFFFLKFVCVFPNETIRVSRWVFRIAAIATIIVVALSIFTPYIDKDEIAKGAERFITYGDFYFLWPVVFVTQIILGGVILLIKIRKSTGIVRAQLYHILFGFLLFLGTVFISNAILPYFNNYSLQPFSPLSTIFFVGFTTYAIVKHRLMNIRLLVARSVAYSILFFLIALIYTVLVYWVGNIFFNTKTEPFELAASVGLALFVAITIQPLKEFLKKNTDRFLYKSQQYKSNFLLSELNTTILHKPDLGNLSEAILFEIVRVMRLTKGAIILLRDDQIDQVKLVDYPNKSEFELETLKELACGKRIIIAQEEENNTLKKIMEDLGIGIAFPLYTGAVIHGIVLLGEKKNGEIFTEEDIQFFEIFIPNFAIAIENAKSLEAIKDFNETLKEKVDEQTKDLRSANQHLKELDKLKDEFIAWYPMSCARLWRL